MVRPAQGPGVGKTPPLLHPLLRRAKDAEKKGFLKLLTGTIQVARDLELVSKQCTQAAIDSTGYEDHHTSEYYGKRSGIKKTHFPKLSLLCDTRTHLYLGGLADQGPKPDDREFGPMVRMAFFLQPFGELLADAGYDAEPHHRFLREGLGVQSIIPPTRGRPTLRRATGQYRRLMQRRFPRDRYGQRWQIESCFSQDKRRFGSWVDGLNYWSRNRKLTLRALVHNLALLLRPHPNHPIGPLFNRAGHS